MRARLTRERGGATLAGLVAAGLAAALSITGVVRGFDERALGQLMRLRERPPSDQVAVVAIDEPTLRALGWPVPRAEQAAVLAAIGQAGARAVAYDIYFSGPAPDGPAADDLFAAVAALGPPVVFALEPFREPVDPRAEAALRRQGVSPGPAALTRLRDHAGALLPSGPLADAGTLSQALYLPAPSGTYRRIPLFERIAGSPVPALALATVVAGDASGIPGHARGAPDAVSGATRTDAAALTADTPAPAPPAAVAWTPGDRVLELGGRRVRTDAALAAVPSLRAGLDEGTLSFQALARALDPDTGRLPEALAARLAGRYVLVGQTAHSLGDHGPAADGRMVPLLHVHAALVADLLEGRVLTDLSPGGSLLLLAVLALLATAMGAWLRPAVGAALLALGVGGLWASVGALLDTAGVLAGPVSLSVAPVFAFGSAAVTRLVLQERERRVLKSAFGAYVAPEVLDRVLSDPERFLVPQGTRKRLSILFSDIQGYTRMSNTLPAEEVVGLLREYLDAMTAIIFRHEGRVDKIMGDGILAYFGDLVPVADHARRAVQCGLDMQTELQRLVKRWATEGKDGLLVRVGTATGEVFVGNIGGTGHLEYTVLGPTVNLAARLESNAPPAGVLVSRETFEETRDTFEYRLVPGLALKGFSDAYTAFLCIGPAAAGCAPADRRRALRLQAEAPVRVAIRDVVQAGVVREVSAGGLLIETPGPASLDEVVSLDFEAPLCPGLETVHLAGSVRHVRHLDDGRVQLGLALVNVECPDAGALREFVALFFGARPADGPGELLGDSDDRFSLELGETYGRLIRA